MSYVKKNISLPEPIAGELSSIAQDMDMPLSTLISDLLNVAVSLGPLSFSTTPQGDHVLQLGTLTLVYSLVDEGKYRVNRIYNSIYGTPRINSTGL